MGKTRTRGITLENDGIRTVNKVWHGERIFQRLGAVSQDDAEKWLAEELARRRAGEQRRRSTRPLFSECAARYLIESREKRSAETIAWHVKLLLPFLGTTEIQQIHDETLIPFIESRQAEGVSATTVNRSIEVVRTVLTRAARAWRDERGEPLLDRAPPLLTMLTENPRPPRPITWDEQDALFPRLPAHLQQMALFALNTGLRDENVCGLRWDWEVAVPEVSRSVFLVPASEFKTGVPHVAILNDAAWRIVEAQRAVRMVRMRAALVERSGADQVAKMNDEMVEKLLASEEAFRYVFVYRGHRVDTMNNNGWQKARREAGLNDVRIHDLRHTYAGRLRLAGVSQEDRNALMGHQGRSIPELYAAADVGRLIEMANRVLNRAGTRTLLRVVNG